MLEAVVVSEPHWQCRPEMVVYLIHVNIISSAAVIGNQLLGRGAGCVPKLKLALLT
jgi:hypothetical protein